ncbi:hypothetical protein EYC84_001265 [Monilinia fructicola]|uniref:Orp1 like protein n=1 Tax=Monilinia fructicola TaxID=38448 RepID=A0A5M9JPF3_MONFR|nr:hypothetical protein EYC84_001265 [Monilinia fructicola]
MLLLSSTNVKGRNFVLPSRNRTPWDAGGYSLPINTSNRTMNIGEQLSTGNESSTANQKIHFYDSHGTDSERSPHHKFSDSRSSLSSFTSTTNSITTSTSTHSRFSSSSTANSTYPISFTQSYCNSSVENPTDLNCSPYSNIPQHKISSRSAPTSPHNTRKVNIMVSSPTENLDALATLAEQESSRSPENKGVRSRSVAVAPGASLVDSNDSIKEPHSRPGSPSDAMLIRRSDLSHSSTDPSDNDLESDHSYNQRALFAHTQDGGAMNPVLHKRDSSAPTSRRPSRAPRTSIGPIPELTPPNSSRLANLPSPLDDEDEDAEGDPATPPQADDDEDADQPPDCMYIPNCDTGSQPRKAISHIFGRNKMCTRLIPQSVWVHYCRKHYQRSRYRNPKEYAKLQCDLVQQQIRRVHDWSQQNHRRGEPGTIRDWGIAIRKREQKRLDELKGSGRKRRASAFDDEDDGDDDASPRPPTAVPDWLLSVIGSGYTTEEILEIFNRLHQEVLDDLLPCFPDVEILPNITVDEDEPKSPKGYAKRKASSAGHKRSKSLNVGAMKTTSNYSSPAGPDRRMSQPSTFQIPNTGVPVYSTTLKRRRPNPGDVNAQYSGQQFAPLPAEVDNRRLSFQPNTFSAFERIDEGAVRVNDFEQPRGRHYGRSSSVYQSPLPAPIARPLVAWVWVCMVVSPVLLTNAPIPIMIIHRGGIQASLMSGTAMQPNLVSPSQNFNGTVEFTTPQYQHPSFGQLTESRQHRGSRQNSYAMQQQGRRQSAQQQHFSQPQQFRQQSSAGGSVSNSPVTGSIGQDNNSTPQQGSQSNARRGQNLQMRGNQMFDNNTRRNHYEQGN